MQEPYFSVIIPCYNVEKYVREAIQSVFQQTLSDWEAIIVNDGSTDSTGRIIEESIKTERRAFYFSKPNEGVAATFNYAIEKARGKYIALFGPDDLWFPEYLEMQKNFLQKSPENLGFIFPNAFIIYGTHKTSKKYFPDIAKYYPSAKNGISLIKMIESNKIFGMAIIPKRTLVEVGGFDPLLRSGSDYDLWLRIMNQGYIPLFNPMTKVFYRIRPESLSNNRKQVLDTHNRIYKKMLDNFKLSPVERKAALMALSRIKREQILDKIKEKIRANDSFYDELAELGLLNSDAKTSLIGILFSISPYWTEKIVRGYFHFKNSIKGN